MAPAEVLNFLLDDFPERFTFHSTFLLLVDFFWGRLRNAGAAVADHVGKLMPVLARQASPEVSWHPSFFFGGGVGGGIMAPPQGLMPVTETG